MKRWPRQVQALLLLGFLGAAIFAAVFLVARGTNVGPGTVRAAGGQKAAARYGVVDVLVDAGAKGLAAYQCEVTATGGDVSIVGIEGGEHAAFKEPPYYDPAALQNHRVILGAFNTGSDLPTGRTRVARLMVRIGKGDEKPAYMVKLMVAADAQGAAIGATASVVEGGTR